MPNKQKPWGYSDSHKALTCLFFVAQFVNKWDKDYDDLPEKCSKDYMLEEFIDEIKKIAHDQHIVLQDLIKFISKHTNQKRTNI